MARRILLVDDEPLMIKGLKRTLEQDGYETDSASDGEEALKKLNSEHYDLVLLDVMLPKLSGIEVCQIVRETSDIPIIMLTAKGEDMDKILGLEYGADDYMTKPFNILEVKARIKSILRRAGANREAPKMELSANGLSINIGSRSATLDGKNVSLTMKEFDLLQLFMKNPGKVYSRDELLETIWGQDYLGDFRTVDVHIRRLREKIERDPANPEYIITLRSERKQFFGSIRVRMVAIYLAVTIVALLAISFTVAILVESSLVNQRTKQQQEATTRLALEISQSFDSDADTLYSLALTRAQEMGGRVLIMDTDAVVQIDSASYQTGFMLPYREVRDVLIGGKEAAFGFHRISTGADKSALKLSGSANWAVYYTAPITQGGKYLGAVLFSAMIQDVEDSVADIIAEVAIVFGIVAAVMVALSFTLSGFVTKPIVELTHAIRRMGKQGSGVRVKVHGQGEVAELGRAFNRMSEQIEAHDRVRDEFVSNASHELKTPLATMKLLSESILYEENPDPAEMRELFEDVNHEVDRMSNVITDLLRLVQFDEGQPLLHRENVDLKDIAERVVSRLKPLAENKGIALNFTGSSAMIFGEERQIEQAVVNLIENAVKYTDAGHVDAAVKQTVSEAQLIVKDTGIGIPEDAIPHLFERFYRVDKARSRGTGGTGLGLAIVERIITLHGGFITVESELGHGSTFTVHLPLADGEE